MVTVKRRTFSRYVSRDPATGAVDYRVPADCVKWPQPFRLRVVREWRPPISVFTSKEARTYANYMSVPPYVVHGQVCQFVIEGVDLGNHRFNCVTYLESDRNDRALVLRHPNPCVRSLLIYSFLTGEHIVGIPAPLFIEKGRGNLLEK